MSKYINIVLLSFFGVLTIKFNLGLTFIIPYICYYGFKNIKNLILIIPVSFISLYIFNIKMYYLYILLYVFLLIILFLKKINKKNVLLIYCFLINIVILLLYKYINNLEMNLILDILSCIISPVLFLFLIYNNYTSKNKNIKSFAYNEILLGIILSVGSINYQILDIEVSILLGIYFSMYYSSNKYIFGSILYSFIVSIVLLYFKNINYSIIIIITSLVYLIPNIFSSIVYIVLLIYVLAFYFNVLPINLFYSLGIITILFEILRPFNINKKNDKEIINDIYDSTISQIDIDLEAFALFLDKITYNISKDDYNEEYGAIIQKLLTNVCGKCEKQNECFKKNKGKLYYYYKNCINGNTDNFICEHSDEMRRMGRMFSNNINKKEYANELLVPLLNGVSNILRYYRINNTIETEIEYKNIIELKNGLMKYGYSICLYNILKTFKSSFLIEVGIIGISFSEEKENLENICNIYLNINCSVSLKECKKNKIYVTIFPKNNYNISYGYGSISKIGNSICGDNYLIKPLTNNKLIAIICDGMGKGLNANIISSRTLKLLDEITNTNISGETSLQILNTLYYIQDYQENYTTIDYVEIDKNTGEMLLYKAGAAYTYIIHQEGNLEKIENDNLPFGLNEMILSKKISLQNNDLVLLASDGIFDNIINMDSFEEFIKSVREFEPQKIAYELLNYARHTDLISKDDMSIIALKIKSI